MKQIKLQLDDMELRTLDELVNGLESTTKIRTTRTAVVRGCYQRGIEALREVLALELRVDAQMSQP